MERPVWGLFLYIWGFLNIKIGKYRIFVYEEKWRKE